MARTTQEVFDNHQTAFQSGDMAELKTVVRLEPYYQVSEWKRTQ
jgi:hypothetical protein